MAIKIFLGSDHAGFKLKNILLKYLTKLRFDCVDIGPFEYNSKDDYPDHIIPTAEQVAKTRNSKGIIIGGSGQGEAICANKVKGIRAAIYYGGPSKIITLAKEHNNANILSIGARFVSEKKAKLMVKKWLNTSFSKEIRHERRIRKIKRFENDCCNNGGKR
jgi:ribose 5-phosphate isomerase B